MFNCLLGYGHAHVIFKYPRLTWAMTYLGIADVEKYIFEIRLKYNYRVVSALWLFNTKFTAVTLT